MVAVGWSEIGRCCLEKVGLEYSTQLLKAMWCRLWRLGLRTLFTFRALCTFKEKEQYTLILFLCSEEPRRNNISFYPCANNFFSPETDCLLLLRARETNFLACWKLEFSELGSRKKKLPRCALRKTMTPDCRKRGQNVLC